MDGFSLAPITSRCGTPAKVPFKKPDYVGRQRDHPNYLATKCKTTAIDIKKRDEMRENRSITRELLIQKFTNKYGPRMKRRIILNVDSFMSTKRDGNVTNEEEKQLESLIISSINDSSLNTSRTDSSEFPATTTPPISQQQQQQPQHLPPPLKLSNPTNNSHSNSDNQPTIRGESYLTPIPMGTEWEAVRLYHNYIAEKNQKEKELTQIQHKKTLSQQLSQQVRENESKREQMKAEERLFTLQARENYEKYRQELEERNLEQERSIKELRESWEAQIAELKAHLEHEKQQQSLEYQHELEELSSALSKEELLLHEQKQQTLQFNQQTSQFNETNQQMKSQQRSHEIQSEKEMLEIYNAMQEERDAHRYDELKRSMERVTKLINWAEKSFPRPVTPSRFINERVEQEKRQLLEEGRQRDLREKEMKMKLDTLTREMNRELMNKKEQEKMEERMKEQELNHLMTIEQQRYEEMKNEMRRNELEKKRELGLSLQRQEQLKKRETVTSSGGGSAAVMMTTTERELNRTALDAVRTDPILNSLFQSRLSHRMRMSGGTTSRGSLIENESDNWNLTSARPVTRASGRNIPPLPSGRLSARPATSSQHHR